MNKLGKIGRVKTNYVGIRKRLIKKLRKYKETSRENKKAFNIYVSKTKIRNHPCIWN